MRNVAVTEGDKLDAQMRLGYCVNGYGVGELVQRMGQVSDAEQSEIATWTREAHSRNDEPKFPVSMG